MQTGYPAARIAAEAVIHHFRGHGKPEANAPETDDIEALIDVSFWASLLREELLTPRVSLAFIPPGQNSALLFASGMPLTSAALTRLAPAVDRPGLHLGISRESSGYCIWGVTRKIPPMSLVIEVVAPGLIVVKHSRRESAKFANLAVLEGNRIRILDHDAPLAPNCPSKLLKLLRLDFTDNSESPNVLLNLASSMRQHGRGGSLLIVPSSNTEWRDSILTPVSYDVSPPFAKVSRLLQMDTNARDSYEWQRALDNTVQTIAGLTAVDGATLINEKYDVLAFGAKIMRREQQPLVTHISMSEPVIGNEPLLQSPSEIGGTRHLSAAQFVQDQQDAVALVASQDGRFTVFSWSACDQMVQAHRVESMLL